MPDVVAHGRKETNARACALCHLTSGGGHPESAGIAGLPAGYFMRQMAEFKSGARKGSRAIADDPDRQGPDRGRLQGAAAYFASLKSPVWYKVVESDTVPKSYLGNGAMRFPVEHGGTEPIGNRIIELPQNDLSAESRDPRTGFVAHVPTRQHQEGRGDRHHRRRRQDHRRARSATAPNSRASARFRRSSAARRCTSTASSTTSRSAPATAPWTPLMKARGRQARRTTT